MHARSITNIAAALCLASLSACVSGPTSNGTGRPDDPPAIGWLHGSCIALTDAAVVPGASVTVVTLDEPRRVVAARIVRLAEAADGCPPLLEDRREGNLAGGLSFYRVDPADGSALAIGVLAPVGVAAAPGAMPDIDGDGREDTFGHCATSEGIRFFVRAGPDGRLLWDGYYHLGYDVQSDCPEAVTGD